MKVGRYDVEKVVVFLRSAFGLPAATKNLVIVGFCRLPLLVLLAPIGWHCNASEYRTPEESISRLVTSPAPPSPMAHPQANKVALLHYEQLISHERLMAKRYGLAGKRIEPITRITGIEPMVKMVELVSLDGNNNSEIWRPTDEGRFDFIQFSPNGQWLSAIKVKLGQLSELWIYDLQRNSAKKLTHKINSAWGNPCSWASNSHLICALTTPHAEPELPDNGPIILEHSGKPLPVRTYQLLLETPHNDAQFEHLFSTQLATIHVTGKVRNLSVRSGLIPQFHVAPNGQHIILRRIEAPYSRLVKAERFPVRVEVWDVNRDHPLFRSALTGFGVEDANEPYRGEAKTLEWHPLLPSKAGFLFQHPDKTKHYEWRSIAEPFSHQESIVAQSATPIKEFGWTTEGTPWFIAESPDGKEDDVYVVQNSENRLLWRGNISDPYETPGQALRTHGFGGAVIESNHEFFIAGLGLNALGPKPFLQAVNLNTGKIRDIHQSQEQKYEHVLALLDPFNEVFLTSEQSETKPTQLVLHKNGKRSVIYSAKDPYPQLQTVERSLIHFKRPDGVALTATLYKPKRDKNRPLPTLIWIYPRDYDDLKLAERVDARPYQFHCIKGPSPIAAALAGYAVVINPTIPIIHSEPFGSDSYLTQLKTSAESLVDYLVENKVSDAKRIAIGGRSYGAFSAVNLLIHSDQFAAAIAMSGAYNRTLTPFGFQHEKRSFWQATEYYAAISPFFHLDQVKSPLLIVHGAEDPNPGTPKMQAKRLYHALVGEGAMVRYVELPGEEHHYRGEKTVLHATWEMIEWLNRTLEQ